ncbi:hypothetical protein [Bernardetia sp.]|uniref:hypothetical protein n=1 Tax=Bernardetia sp. TaxID=1937974 RepID=UPI0025C5D5F7|nr:hypothetical protein [Bernardetia sp.]
MNQSLICTNLDTTLSNVIGKIGLVKTVEILNNFEKGLIYFLPKEGKSDKEQIKDFVLFKLANHLNISENELLKSSKHYHSQIRSIGFLLLSEAGFSDIETAHVFNRKQDFVGRKKKEVAFLVSQNHLPTPQKELYERISHQLDFYGSIK